MRTALGLAALLAALCLGAGRAAAPALGPHGIGAVRFGTPRAKAVAELSALLGAPTSRLRSSGCGPRYSEVAFSDLVAEFRTGSFSGYRYLLGGLPPTSGPARTPPKRKPRPALATAAGITLGSTLGAVKRAYRPLTLVGTDRWQAANGLFFEDGASREPPPASSRIVEIKMGTCGDY